VTNDSNLTRALDTIRSTATRMRSDSDFKCVFEEWPAATEDDITEWEEWADSQPGMAGYRLPPALRAIYRASGGFRWRWQFLADLPSITTGSAELVDLLSLFQRDDEADQPLAGIYRAPRRFDVLSDTEFVGMRFSITAEQPLRLVHIDEDDAMEAELKLGVEQYLPTLARYRAVYGWQSLFHDKSPAANETKSRLDATVARLFP
jgi:hypothetical protein